MAKKTDKEEKHSVSYIQEVYGVTRTVIDKYFGEPELVTNPNYRTAPMMRLYTAAQIEDALKKPEVQAAIEKKKNREQKKNEKQRSAFDVASESINNMLDVAKTLERRFILHVGPTNSGKTYDSIERLKHSESGMYLGPLRLLALEMYDRINGDGIPCSLLTGEERMDNENARITASTIEMCDFDSRYEVAVIDEAQMIVDHERGAAWTKAILMCNASELHVCLAPEAEALIVNLLSSFTDRIETVRHERLTPLKFTGEMADISEVRPGDALITFSRKNVLNLASHLDSLGVKASVIYGSLPPAVRREEVRKFTSGETSVVVATDAIGMGISVPIRRVIFCQAYKFNGKTDALLTPTQVRQIAGRAGRFGIYDCGEVMALKECSALIEMIYNDEPVLPTELTIPFPTDALDSQISLPELFRAWRQLEPPAGFVKENIDSAVYLLEEIMRYFGLARALGKRMTYDLVTCPLDVKNDSLVCFWYRCCSYIANASGRYGKEFLDHFPDHAGSTDTLADCELYYHSLDIRHNILRHLGIEDARTDEKEKICNLINEFLKDENQKKNNILRCRKCGTVLPLNYKYGICSECYENSRPAWYENSRPAWYYEDEEW